MDRLLLYLLFLVIFGVLTFSAQFGFIRHKNDESLSVNNNNRPLPSTIPQAAVQQQRHQQHHHAASGNGGKKNSSCGALLLLTVPRHQAVFLHIGKAAGGTFMHRARHVWKLQVEECHPDPCHYYILQNNTDPLTANNNNNTTIINSTMTAIVSIRDPVDRFVSAFYWKRKTICARHPNLCANAKTWQQQQNLHRHRPPSLSSSSLSLSDTNSSSLDIIEAMQRYILFEKYQQNANMLAESLCRDDNYTAFVDAQVDVGMIAHMKNSIHDWLANDWDVMGENSTTASSSSSMSRRRRRRSIHSIRPIVLEPNFDLEEQIDDALLATIATQEAPLVVEDSCPHRRRPKEGGGAHQEKLLQYKRASRNGGPRHVHSSLQNSNSAHLQQHVLSEKGTRCVAQFYRRDYEIIRQLSHSSACQETCRLALESIWNRRSPLLLLDDPA